MPARYNSAMASELIERFDARPEMLLQILHAFAERFTHISDEAIHQIAAEVNLSRAEIHGVVSFYHDFRRKPAGKQVVKICQAEACQSMGSRELTAHAEKVLGIGLNATTADGETTLEPVYCLGNCACSPAMMVDGRVYGRVNKERFNEILDPAAT